MFFVLFINRITGSDGVNALRHDRYTYAMRDLHKLPCPVSAPSLNAFGLPLQNAGGFAGMRMPAVEIPIHLQPSEICKSIASRQSADRNTDARTIGRASDWKGAGTVECKLLHMQAEE